ncbi:MAG: ABC transporter permease subunit [Limnochordaceae bacterium]|nr:ABC transporter permease subunit [Limnochordaceae bacterium]
MTGYHRFVPRRPGLVDLAVAAVVFALVYALVRVGAGLRAPLAAAAPDAIRLEPAFLPYYAGRSILRMVAAFALSVAFSLGYGYLAARSARAERFLIPLLDVLQSVPVLGFLSVSINALTGLFPGQIVGLELASIFAIFTSQVWNLTFAFYYSLSSLPRELRLVSDVYRLSPWQRFTRLELPGSMIPLVWNGMMSFGGGWFFLAASEAITVLNRRLMLPGVGSYLATALERADARAVGYAILTMALVVLGIDQLVWRPLVAWAERFKLEQTPSAVAPSSAVLMLLRRSALVDAFERGVLTPLGTFVSAAMDRLWRGGATLAGRLAARRSPLWAWAGRVVLVAAGLGLLRYAWLAALLVSHMGARQIGWVAWLGILTLLRVMAAVGLGAAWTVPVGVLIGLHPRLAAMGQGLVQLAAAFPANMLFPFIAFVYARWHVNFEVGSVLLMMLGTQWYILFNVIAGASQLPAELKEAALVFGVGGWTRWRRVILPAVMPSLVTGCLTAAGGAWNASIVAEVTAWGSTRLVATGLGAYITEVTRVGDRAGIVWGITSMAILVVLLNRLLWRPLYLRAESRCSLA